MKKKILIAMALTAVTTVGYVESASAGSDGVRVAVDGRLTWRDMIHTTTSPKRAFDPLSER